MDKVERHDLEIVAAAFLVHCMGGSGGYPFLCRLADDVLDRLGID